MEICATVRTPGSATSMVVGQLEERTANVVKKQSGAYQEQTVLTHICCTSKREKANSILSLSSADSANLLIRDGLLICGTKVWPKKQKSEPIQCMKCRNWGHFASECPSKVDVCGTCGDAHRTTSCQSRNKLRCTSCNSDSHASWSRDCPEFNRRCSLYDERNPENAMPYFPMEHDWSLQTRPPRMSLMDKFPAKYAINSLPYTGNRRPGSAPAQRSKDHIHGEPAKGRRKNPNLIPVPGSQIWGDSLLLSDEEAERVRSKKDALEYESNLTDEPFQTNHASWL